MKYTIFSQLTVGQYQELYSLNASKEDDLEKAIGSISILTGLPRWKVEEMNLADFNKVSSELAIIFTPQIDEQFPKKYLTINNQKYAVQYNPRKITAGQYIDIQHFMQGNMIDNLHKLVACIVVPQGFWKKGKYDSSKHEEISEGIRNLNFIDVNAICVFFLKLWRSSIEVIRPFLENELMRKGMSREKINEMDLQNILDGSILLNR